MLADEDDNQSVYDKVMGEYIQNFLDGYNVNFMAYGQTGSGKTYTLLGPNQTFPKKLTATEVDAPEKNWGIFPRCALKIFQVLKASGLSEEDFLLTIKVS